MHILIAGATGFVGFLPFAPSYRRVILFGYDTLSL